MSPPPGTPIMLVHSMLSLRSLRLSFIFILFSLFFSRAVISTILSSSSLNHSLASFILSLISSSVFFISGFVHLFVSSSDRLFIKHFLYLYLHFFPKILDNLYYLILCFLVDCLSLFQSVVLLGIYQVPLYKTYSSAVASGLPFLLEKLVAVSVPQAGGLWFLLLLSAPW